MGSPESLFVESMLFFIKMTLMKKSNFLHYCDFLPFWVKWVIYVTCIYNLKGYSIFKCDGGLDDNL